MTNPESESRKYVTITVPIYAIESLLFHLENDYVPQHNEYGMWAKRFMDYLDDLKKNDFKPLVSPNDYYHGLTKPIFKR